MGGPMSPMFAIAFEAAMPEEAMQAAVRGTAAAAEEMAAVEAVVRAGEGMVEGRNERKHLVYAGERCNPVAGGRARARRWRISHLPDWVVVAGGKMGQDMETGSPEEARGCSRRTRDSSLAVQGSGLCHWHTQSLV